MEKIVGQSPIRGDKAFFGISFWSFDLFPIGEGEGFVVFINHCGGS
jgi:hypothetical protein